jgi:hypothetical protein
MSLLRFVVLCLAMALLPWPALAVSRVQFQVFYVSTVDPAGRQAQLPITVYMDVPNQQSVNSVCSVGPRVRDAVVVSLRKETYPLDRMGKLDTQRVAQQIRPALESAVGKDTVVGIIVSMEPPKVSAAAASGAFARLGCMGANEQAKAQKGGEKGEAKH